MSAFVPHCSRLLIGEADQYSTSFIHKPAMQHQSGWTSDIGAFAMQISKLEDKLGVLHTTDTNALRRSHRSLSQHIQTLVGEVRNTQAAVSELDGNALVFTSERCVREVCGPLVCLLLFGILRVIWPIATQVRL